MDSEADRLDKHSKQMRALEEQRNRAVADSLEIQRKIQEFGALEQKRKDAVEEAEGCRREVGEADSKLPKLDEGVDRWNEAANRISRSGARSEAERSSTECDFPEGYV